MKQFSSVDLYFFIKENKELIENSRVEIFYLDESLFTTRLYVKGQGNLFLTTSIGSYIYLSKKKYNAPFHPTSFVSYMRKYLKNSFIDSIEQIGLERVLKLVLSKKDGEEIKTYNLYVELFAGGNIIICDSEDTILNSLIKKTYKDRNVRNKQHYELPPKKNFNPVNPQDNSKEIVENSQLTIVKFLAIECGLGGKYSEEICLELDIDKNKLASEVGFEKVCEILNTLFSKNINPHVVKSEKYEDYFPFEPQSKKNIEKKNSFNECIIEYYKQFEEKKDVKDDEYQKKLKKLQKRIEKQEEKKTQVLNDSDEYFKKGEKIYENYGEIEELLNGILKASKEKGWDYVFDTIENNEKLKSMIEKLDYKNNKIILNL